MNNTASRNPEIHIGIDLGGTKIEAIALDRQGHTKYRKRVPTPKDDYNGIIKTIAGLVNQIESELGARGTVGVGTPGAISPASGLIKNSNTTCLIDKPMHLDLQKAMAREVRLANDADCFVVSEAIDGAGASANVVFGVIIGTGTGGGIVIQKRRITGPNAIAGEWGHNPLPWPTSAELPGDRCYCGKSGCIETFLSGPGLSREYARVAGMKATSIEVARLAREGDEKASETIVRYTDRMARALSSVINILDPDVIVLGGGLSNIECLYTDVPKLLDRYVFSDQVDTRLVRAVHGDSSGVRGAAWLWWDPPSSR